MNLISFTTCDVASHLRWGQLSDCVCMYQLWVHHPERVIVFVTSMDRLAPPQVMAAPQVLRRRSHCGWGVGCSTAGGGCWPTRRPYAVCRQLAKRLHCRREPVASAGTVLRRWT